MAAKIFEIGEVLPNRQLIITTYGSDTDNPVEVGFLEGATLNYYGNGNAVDINMGVEGEWISLTQMIVDFSNFTPQELTVLSYNTDSLENRIEWEVPTYALSFQDSEGRIEIGEMTELTEFPEVVIPNIDGFTFNGFEYEYSVKAWLDVDTDQEFKQGDRLTKDTTVYPLWSHEGNALAPKLITWVDSNKLKLPKAWVLLAWRPEEKGGDLEVGEYGSYLGFNFEQGADSHDYYVNFSLNVSYDEELQENIFSYETRYKFPGYESEIVGESNLLTVDLLNIEEDILITYEGNQDIFWKQISDGQQHLITYQTNGGENIEPASEESIPYELPIPTRENYTFISWCTDVDLTNVVTPGDYIYENITLYAKWHNHDSLFTEIADEIRKKDGSADPIKDVDFGKRIKSLPEPVVAPMSAGVFVATFKSGDNPEPSYTCSLEVINVNRDDKIRIDGPGFCSIPKEWWGEDVNINIRVKNRSMREGDYENTRRPTLLAVIDADNNLIGSENTVEDYSNIAFFDYTLDIGANTKIYAWLQEAVYSGE